MAKIRVRAESESKPDEMVRVIRPHREDGWFSYTEYEIPLSVLEEQTVISKIQPDLFPQMKDQLVWKIRDIFGI